MQTIFSSQNHFNVNLLYIYIYVGFVHLLFARYHLLYPTSTLTPSIPAKSTQIFFFLTEHERGLFSTPHLSGLLLHFNAAKNKKIKKERKKKG